MAYEDLNFVYASDLLTEKSITADDIGKIAEIQFRKSVMIYDSDKKKNIFTYKTFNGIGLIISEKKLIAFYRDELIMKETKIIKKLTIKNVYSLEEYIEVHKKTLDQMLMYKVIQEMTTLGNKIIKKKPSKVANANIAHYKKSNIENPYIRQIKEFFDKEPHTGAIILNCATGSGKSYASCLSAAEFVKENLNEIFHKRKIIFLTSSVGLRKSPRWKVGALLLV